MMNYVIEVTTPWNACQFQALSIRIKQFVGVMNRVLVVTSFNNIAEANITGASREGVL